MTAPQYRIAGVPHFWDAQVSSSTRDYWWNAETLSHPVRIYRPTETQANAFVQGHDWGCWHFHEC